MEAAPLVDITGFVNGNPSPAECQAVAEALKNFGCLIVRDPRVNEADNDQFVDMMEDYFGQPEDVKRADARPELHYQVGATPAFVEKPRDHTAFRESLPAEQRPKIPDGKDPKWRFFWRIGTLPETTRFPKLNAPQVIPEAFKEVWPAVMDKWGSLMMQTVRTVATMAAVGFNLPANTFVDLLNNGPHLLAPTGTDVVLNNQPNKIYAGVHYDLNFLTIHGKSRYPGLFVWLRDGRKIPVRVPPGCLLLQAGKQFEYLTGGEVLAGFHEVVCTDDTLAALERQRAAGRPLWRISSTLFSHVASDNLLQPLGQFASLPGAAEKYPPMYSGEQVQRELNVIKLGKTDDDNDEVCVSMG
eukprot:gnl/Hemi2/18821_TR6230_c0_g1_i1.p1 gnl/Hemi2/18821_TR6230_c0_g1~~gnl/Hemi2/18821_TR6230_c0_g1_i1.p1  ORF type:complete len:356 (-),score=117.25 gnl/Hemi2/18821_TR6230_c0_g1_i1:86-1153(-)